MGMEPATKHPSSSPPPLHVAIIMDGNGRWAQRRGLPRIVGHKRGAEALRETLIAAKEFGITYLTVFGFSSENWRRPPDEINELMGLLCLYLRKELAELHKNNVCMRVIGERERLDDDIVRLIENAENQTRDNTGLYFTLALSYGSRSEIVGAVRAIASEVAAGDRAVSDITEENFSTYLTTAGLPDPDLVIRTSGEMRLSNFLLWQSAYSEMFFTDKLWPDFGKQDLLEAISEFQRRERRYGACDG